MIRSDEHWLSTIDAFQAAALGAQSWETALHGVAESSGSQSVQLAGIDVNLSVLFNVLTNIDPAADTAFRTRLAINPRFKVCNELPVLKVTADADFITAEESRRDPFYQEVLYPLDRPFVCMTTLERNEGRFIVLAALRSQRAGHITDEQRAIFAGLAPHVRTAVRTQLALQGHGAAVLAGAFENLSIPVFLAGRSGKVSMLTQAAEALLARGRGLQIRAGQLRASQPDDTKALTDAIEAAAIGYARPGPPILRTVIIHSPNDDAGPIVLDVFPLPSAVRHHSFDISGSVPCAVVVARGAAGGDGRRAAILTAVYGLTCAEADIARYIARGRTAEFIASSRGVAVGTVRAQIKTILAKVGVRRQTELAARLNQL
jgi:DNA-binding CsgD family transcriptional regulator/GAF domain-containing protein